MTLFAFRGAKSPAWTFCDPIKVDHDKIQWVKPEELLDCDLAEADVLIDAELSGNV